MVLESAGSLACVWKNPVPVDTANRIVAIAGLQRKWHDRAGNLAFGGRWHQMSQSGAYGIVANSIAESQSASSRATLERAAALQRRADRTGAIKQYQKLLKNDPGDPLLLNMCAIAAAEAGDLKAVARDPAYADVITADSGDQAGWIEFGRPQEHPHAQAEPVVRAYQPYEGMAVLFPSYFYHRTKPFESEDKRISIAFDIVPAA